MRKLYVCAALIITAALVVSLCSCSGEDGRSCADMLGELLEEVPHREGDAVYLCGSAETSDNYIDPLELGRLFYTDAQTVPDELEKLEDYAIYISASAPDEPPREIHVFKVRNRSERDSIEEAVRRRAELLTKPEISGAFPGVSARVSCKGRTVCLFVGF